MQPKPSTKPAESTKASTAPPSKASLTPQELLEAQLWRKKMDKMFQESFKDGLDLSGQETR